MAIHAITGVMGSGKSYEAVSEKIVPALRDEVGRRVVTNIEGLNVQAISAFIGKPEAEVESRLVRVSYERVSEPKFWYDPDGGATDTVVQPGDLVVLDEVWRYFNRGLKLPDDAMRFFRMHRHYVSSESGLTCDVVLINQALRGIHQDIRDVVELQFACRKLKALGRPQNYQVFLHENGERKHSHAYLRTYSSKVFPLYSSYNGAKAKEAVDKRQNALNTPLFKYVLPTFLVLSVAAGWQVYRYFAGMGKPAVPVEASPASAPAVRSASAPVAASPSVPSAFSAPPPGFAAAATWRVVSTYKLNDVLVAIVVNDAGGYRTVPVVELRQSTGTDLSIRVPDLPTGYASPVTGPAGTYNSSAARAQAPGAFK